MNWFCMLDGFRLAKLITCLYCINALSSFCFQFLHGILVSLWSGYFHVWWIHAFRYCTLLDAIEDETFIGNFLSHVQLVHGFLLFYLILSWYNLGRKLRRRSTFYSSILQPLEGSGSRVPSAMHMQWAGWAWLRRSLRQQQELWRTGEHHRRQSRVDLSFGRWLLTCGMWSSQLAAARCMLVVMVSLSGATHPGLEPMQPRALSVLSGVLSRSNFFLIFWFMATHARFKQV